MTFPMKKAWLVTPVAEPDDNTEKFIVAVQGNEYWAEAIIYSHYCGLNGKRWGKVFVGKKWDGQTVAKVDWDFGSYMFESLYLMQKSAAFFCDQLMAAYRTQEEWTDWHDEVLPFEGNLAKMNCDNGADANPGIYFEEVPWMSGSKLFEKTLDLITYTPEPTLIIV